MIQLPENFDSIFRYIVVVSQRAEQLISGAKVRSESRSAKSTLQARDDVDSGEVEWRILTQEELDAQRQAMVDQFRAEVDAAGEAVEAAAIPDVLPTSETEAKAPAAEVPESDGDEELARLQRLLGMVKQVEGTDDSEAVVVEEPAVDLKDEADAESADEPKAD